MRGVTNLAPPAGSLNFTPPHQLEILLGIPASSHRDATRGHLNLNGASPKPASSGRQQSDASNKGQCPAVLDERVFHINAPAREFPKRRGCRGLFVKLLLVACSGDTGLTSKSGLFTPERPVLVSNLASYLVRELVFRCKFRKQRFGKPVPPGAFRTAKSFDDCVVAAYPTHCTASSA